MWAVRRNSTTSRARSLIRSSLPPQAHKTVEELLAGAPVSDADGAPRDGQEWLNVDVSKI
jgi:hypothetical protein